MAESVNLVRARANAGARIESDDILFQFDATLTVSMQDDGQVTQVPIEVAGEPGANVADHYTNAPLKLTLSGIVTDTPNVVDGVTPQPGRALRLLDALRALKQRGQPVTIVTAGRGSFDRMVIVSISEQHSLSQGHAVGPTVVLEQVRFASSQVTFIPPLAAAEPERRSSDVSSDNGADDAAAGEDERGRQTSTTSTPEESAGAPPAVRLFGGLLGV